MRKLLLSPAALLTAGVLAGVLGVTTAAAGAPVSPSARSAAAATASGEQPPECIHITVQSLQSDGTTVNLHYEFCGSGSGADSALHDWVNHDYFILDGGGMPGVACGGWTDPCVVFPR